jgi:hypothetical protein
MFQKVFSLAQVELIDKFGMEMQPLPVREKTTAEKRKGMIRTHTAAIHLPSPSPAKYDDDD